MTIKEVEERTGLARANIRFYEEEGLICPLRLANGYRDYSEEDQKTLLKIKLPRRAAAGPGDHPQPSGGLRDAGAGHGDADGRPGAGPGGGGERPADLSESEGQWAEI